VSRWSEGYASDVLKAFNKDIFPYIGQQPVNEIKPLIQLNVLRRMESRGATEKARKVRQRSSEVYRYAIVTGRAEYNPAVELTSAMTGHESKHYPFLAVDELPDVFKALWLYRKPVSCSCRSSADPHESSHWRASRCFLE